MIRQTAELHTNEKVNVKYARLQVTLTSLVISLDLLCLGTKIIVLQ